MLLALLVMASGLVVAGVTAPAAGAPPLTAETISSSSSWTAGGAGEQEVVRFRPVPVESEWLAPPRTDVAAASSRSGGPLLLFLPAPGRSPNDYQRFLASATGAGYQVLALDSGTPARLRPALARLAQDDPAGGWRQYLDGDAVRWSDVVVAGHAAARAEALSVARDRPVRGVLLLARTAAPLVAATPLSHGPVRVSDRGLLGDGGEQPGRPDWQRVLTRFL